MLFICLGGYRDYLVWIMIYIYCAIHLVGVDLAKYR